MRAGERVKHLISLNGCNDMSHYKVMVDDNFHYGEEDERWEYGVFATADEALAACRTVVDQSLLHEYKEGGVTAEGLFDRYTSFGDEPFVVATGAEKRIDFSARSYAQAQSIALTSGLAGWLRRAMIGVRVHMRNRRMLSDLRSRS